MMQTIEQVAKIAGASRFSSKGNFWKLEFESRKTRNETVRVLQRAGYPALAPTVKKGVYYEIHIQFVSEESRIKMEDLKDGADMYYGDVFKSSIQRSGDVLKKHLSAETSGIIVDIPDGYYKVVFNSMTPARCSVKVCGGPLGGVHQLYIGDELKSFKRVLKAYGYLNVDKGFPPVKGKDIEESWLLADKMNIRR